jgi:hypothetical protein
VRVGIDAGRELEKYHRVTAGVFLAWAAIRGLLDEARFAKHEGLLAAVKQREATGTQLFDALGRGLWDDHLVNDADLRQYAFCYFHNMGAWITADFKEVFGKRTGPYGHDEPKLDEATWDAVDQAARVLDERFERWLRHA